MTTVEVRSNIAGDILKIRKGVVYKDNATVLDELLQNCQRAGASRVDITMGEDTLVMEDDGVGCPDPQSLFEKNTSAWGNEDEAFGEGFFSIFLLADHVTVRSHTWEIKLDVLDMMERQDMTVHVKDDLAHAKGFRIELKGERIQANTWTLRSELNRTTPFLPMDVTVNNIEIQKEMLIDSQSETDYVFENDLMQLVLSPYNGFRPVEFYYEDRPVTEKYYSGVKGRVLVKKGKATPKAPDRKEFVYDDKYWALDRAVKEAIVAMYTRFVQVATDAELDTFEEGISYHLEVEDYAEYLTASKQLFFANISQSDGEMEDEPTPPEEAELLDDLPAWLTDASLPDEDAEWQGEVDRDVRTLRSKGVLERLLNEVKHVLYVPTNEVEEHADLIKHVEYMGFTVLYARNRLYAKAFSYYGVQHIMLFEELTEEQSVIERTEPRTKKEERFLALMTRVEEHYKLQPGSIKLADLGRQVISKEDGEILMSEYDNVHGLCVHEDKVIYLDRSVVGFPSYRAQQPDYPQVTVHDMRVLLRITQLLAHELAHLVYNCRDNTLEHSQMMVKIG